MYFFFPFVDDEKYGFYTEQWQNNKNKRQVALSEQKQVHEKEQALCIMHMAPNLT